MLEKLKEQVFQAIINASLVASIPAIVSSCVPSEQNESSILKYGDTILFQGDRTQNVRL